jgi:tetratricopeptide (TPR) repeat protein
MFVIGLTALIVVGSTRPLWLPLHSQSVGRHLSAARRALEPGRLNLDEAIHRSELVLAHPQATPPDQGEAHYLLGTASLRRAEQVGPELAGTCLEMARIHLEQAEQIGVPPGYEGSLRFRLAKTWFLGNRDPQRVVAYLERSVEAADDLFDGYGILAQAYLRLPRPNLRAALETVQKQLAVATIDPAVLARPRLLCGQLHRQLNQPEEAARVLSRIGSDAPPELLFEARHLRAQILHEQGYWADALAMWELVGSDPQASSIGGARVWYPLGLCYRRLGQDEQAQRAWERAARYDGEEAQAAALGLAELRLHSSQPAAAVDAFETAVNHLAGPGDYRNSLINLSAARGMFESGIRWYLQVGQHESALKLAQHYEKIALPGVAQELAGQAAEAWGKSLLDQPAASHQAAQLNQEDARAKFELAGSLFERAASLTPNPQEQADWLWRSARLYLDGGEPARALPMLERVVALPAPPERLGEAWFARGEAFRALRQDALAQAAYRHCIKYPGRFGPHARYQLAVYEIPGNPDEAAAILTQNLPLCETDPEAHQKTLFALASLLFDRREYRMALVRLEEALTRFPDHPEALKLRYRLGLCNRFLADDAARRLKETADPDFQQHYARLRQQFLDSAASHFAKVGEECSRRTDKGERLGAELEQLCTDAAFAAADCSFDLGRFDQALPQYDELARRHRNRVEELLALRNIWRCYGVKFEQTQAQRTLRLIEAALKEMPDSAFDGSSEVRTRRWWEEWVREKKQMTR